MFNLFKKKEVAATKPANIERKLSLNLYYFSACNKNPYGMFKERVSDTVEEHQKFRKIYEDELNDGLAKLNAAKDDEFVKILDAVFQKKYFVSLYLCDSVAD